MFPRGRKNRVVAAVALTAVLSLALAAPASAAGWGGWSQARELAGGLLPRVLAWLGVAPQQPVSALSCNDDGLHVDPNGGCTKAAAGPGLSPSRSAWTRNVQAQQGSSNGQR